MNVNYAVGHERVSSLSACSVYYVSADILMWTCEVYGLLLTHVTRGRWPQIDKTQDWKAIGDKAGEVNSTMRLPIQFSTSVTLFAARRDFSRAVTDLRTMVSTSLCIGKLIYHAMPWICLSMLFRSLLQHYCSQHHTVCRRGSQCMLPAQQALIQGLMLHYNKPYLCFFSSVPTFLRGWSGSSDVGNIKS